MQVPKETEMKNTSPKIPHEELKNLYGKEYVEMYRSFSIFRLERLLIYVQLAPDYCVADFACGDGRLMPYVASKVKSYVGVDFSDEMIKLAVEAKNHLGLKNVDFYCEEIEDFCEVNQNKFDCGFALDFSEHVYDDDWLSILVHIKKTLKPGGKLYVHTPNAHFFIELMKQKSIIFKQHKGHIAVRSPEENTALLEKAGFKITRLLLIPHYNILRHIHFLSHLPIVGKYFLARVFIEASSEN